MSDAELKKPSRREALGMLSTAGAVISAGCSSYVPSSPTATTAPVPAGTAPTTRTPPVSSAACLVTPSETAGPFPSIALPVRSDVREDRTGLLLTLAISVVNTSASCAPVVNASVEIWHCDAAGNYSEYGNLTSSTWLRGIQPVDANGVARFTTIYPGWYAGRATHIHIEVLVNNRSVKTTQLAFPEEINSAVCASGVYSAKGQNPTKAGYAATFTVGVAL